MLSESKEFIAGRLNANPTMIQDQAFQRRRANQDRQVTAAQNPFPSTMIDYLIERQKNPEKIPRGARSLKRMKVKQQFFLAWFVVVCECVFFFTSHRSRAQRLSLAPACSPSFTSCCDDPVWVS